MADYSQISDPDLQAKARARYEAAIAGLSRQGFRHLAFSLEALGPYSAIFQFPLLLLALFNREIIRVLPPFRIALANVLMAHDDPPSIALCMGLGVKIYSGFTDQTLLISSTFQSDARPKVTSPIVRFFPSKEIDLAWASHRESVKALAAKGKVPWPDPSFQRYRLYSLVEEDLTQYH